MVDNVLKKIRAELIKDESAVPKNMEILTKEVEKLKTSRDNLEKEVKSGRRGLDNWKSEVKNIFKQIENDVDKKINNTLEALVKAKKELNDDVQTIILSIKQKVKDEHTAELFKLDSPGRRGVQEEVTKAEEAIRHNIDDNLVIEFDEEDNLKDALMKKIKEELGLEVNKTELGN